MTRRYVFQGTTYTIAVDYPVSIHTMAQLHDGELFGMGLTAELKEQLNRNSARETRRINRLLGIEEWQ